MSARKGGGFYGYKIDAAVCTATDLPVAWNVRTARDNESIHALPLIDKARERGIAVETAAMDKGYDVSPVYDGCEDRGVRPINPAPQHRRRRARRPQAADVRARRVAVRRSGLPAQGDQVALPDRRVQARVPLGQSGPVAPADAARDSGCTPI